jgi:hypothetical protein
MTDPKIGYFSPDEEISLWINGKRANANTWPLDVPPRFMRTDFGHGRLALCRSALGATDERP